MEKVFFFNLQIFFIHNNKQKDTNSIAKYKHNIFTIVYHNTTISLIQNLS